MGRATLGQRVLEAAEPSEKLVNDIPVHARPGQAHSQVLATNAGLAAARTRGVQPIHREGLGAWGWGQGVTHASGALDQVLLTRPAEMGLDQVGSLSQRRQGRPLPQEWAPNGEPASVAETGLWLPKSL